MKRSVVVTSFCNNVTRIVMASALAELNKAAGLEKRKAKTTTHLEHVLERKAPAWARKVERVLRREAERVAARLVELLGDKLAKDDSAVSAEIQLILEELKLSGVSSQVVQEITPEMIAAFGKAGIISVGQVGIDYTQDITNHVDKKAIEYAAKRGAELVTQITEATRDEMRDLVERAVTEGMSAQKLAEEVRESRSFSKARSLMIGRTELAFAHVAGNLEGWRESGVVESKQWQASINCCPECDAMDGVVVKFDEKFDFEGEQVDGPPGHPNCRCDVLPVLFDEGDK